MKNKSNLIGLIDIRQNYHHTQSIDRWKQAINAFESLANPSRVLLYDMYDDILLDGQVEATWSKRVDSILNRRLSFVRDGVEDEDVTRLLNSPDMRNLIAELLFTVVYGYTLIQVNGIRYDEEQEQYSIDFDLIPRKHVHPERGFECVSKEQYGAARDFLYTQPPLSHYMIAAGNPDDMGLFVKVAPYVIYKRGGFGDWSQFSEMFGMPFREAIYNGFDDDSRRKIEEAMKEWGGSTYFLHDENVKIILHPTGGSTQSSEVYDRFIQVCDAGISKTILGNTLTTEHGENGNRSLGEVHAGEEDAKKQSDERFILSVLNTQFRSVLKRFGVNVTGGEIWFASLGKDWNALQAKWNVVSAISDKIPVADDYIYEEFDVPKPENYDELKEEMRLEKHAAFASIFDAPDPMPAPKEKLREIEEKAPKNGLLKRLSAFFLT